jgi:hypothetical protein
VIEKRELPLPPIARDSTPLAPQPSNDPRLVRVGLIAHVSHIGDVYEPDGYVDLGKDLHTLQGLAAEDADFSLEYRVRGPDHVWGPWLTAPEYAGTRGRALLLTGVAVRLRETAKGKYTLRTFGRFVGSPTVVIAADGEDCVAPDGADLRGVQIELMRAVAP